MDSTSPPQGSQSSQENPSSIQSHIPALTGIRFFAVLHIFMFHLWVLYDLDKPEDFTGLMSGFGRLPEGLITFFSHGWMATSFFFILSGFILAYLYWDETGHLKGGNKRFWLRRLMRLYPIHIIVLSITFLMMGSFYIESMSVVELLPSAIANIVLVQSWYPPWVPMWSWPTWTISTLLFLYFIMPWLAKKLAALSHKNMWRLLFALPFISLLPTCIYAVYFPTGSEPVQNWQIFIGSTPLFWVAQFAAGMLLSRVTKISRFNTHWRENGGRKLAWGDLAFLCVIAIACIPGIEEPLKYFLRHGLMMPFFLIIIFDMAKGNGFVARIFSLPGTDFLGQTAYAMFIWQNLAMVICWLTAKEIMGAGQMQVWAAPLGLIVVAIMSTYLIEKPIARKLRKAIEG